MLGDRQRGSEPRRLDAEQVYQTGQAMHLRSIDAEIGVGIRRSAEFGPHTAIAGRQRCRIKRGPPGGDQWCIKAWQLRRDGIIDLCEVCAEHLALGLDPFPRSADAEYVEKTIGCDDVAEVKPSPFAVLANLTQKKV